MIDDLSAVRSKLLEALGRLAEAKPDVEPVRALLRESISNITELICKRL